MGFAMTKNLTKEILARMPCKWDNEPKRDLGVWMARSNEEIFERNPIGIISIYTRKMSTMGGLSTVALGENSCY